ncbi:coagulation factor VIII-like [Paramuricea clavata]|uniref:Coagulation factor VIII-like n=1 Tax=Paramuricea clavata TaxID=317549 RepID=A0A6S7H6L5_PARCT|nr:coagulation factor VIII-like [Paramuricea clavata]
MMFAKILLTILMVSAWLSLAFGSSQSDEFVAQEPAMDVESDHDLDAVNDTDDVMEDVMLKRKAAMDFFQRDRRGLHHECYDECCSWEEVREHYEHDIPAAIKYWRTYQSHRHIIGC